IKIRGQTKMNIKQGRRHINHTVSKKELVKTRVIRIKHCMREISIEFFDNLATERLKIRHSFRQTNRLYQTENTKINKLTVFHRTFEPKPIRSKTNKAFMSRLCIEPIGEGVLKVISI
ncbi:Unknown protein, partial [Striga hermonthica]